VWVVAGLDPPTMLSSTTPGAVVVSARELSSIKARALTGKLVMDASVSEAARKAERKALSTEKAGQWKDTLSALRLGKERARAVREEQAEAARVAIDKEVGVIALVSFGMSVRRGVRGAGK
jgi:hypothetical protein